MRAPAILVLAALAAGCGASSTTTRGNATITQTLTETVGDVDDPFAKRAVAPTLSLRSVAATVRAAQGSSCVEYTDPDTGEGTSVCADTPYPVPRQVVIVRPGERVRFALRGGDGFLVAVHRFGCHRTAIRRVRVAPAGRWRVNLRPGIYELVVSVRAFRIGARHGDTSGGFGIWVSRRKPRDVVPASSVSAAGC